MNFSTTTLVLDALTKKSIDSLENDMKNYKLLESDTKEFLASFCKPEILNSLFINQIGLVGFQAVCDFQEHIFKYVKDYFYKLINIEDLTFSYNAEQFPLIISVSMSGMILCNIDIFNKKVEVLEEFYFKDIKIITNELKEQKELLERELSKFSSYAQDITILCKENNDMTFFQNLDVMTSSLKKDNKYKKHYDKECALIAEELLQIDAELEEYSLYENNIRKNMIHINYYQDRISDRLSRHLNYTVVKN